VFNGTNLLGKGNPGWPISNALETKTVPGAICSGCGLALAWLTGLPRRAGRHLFAMNDAEARWHRWLVTETLGGLGRQYRDSRFDALGLDPALRRDGCPLSGEGLWRSAAPRARTTRA